MDWWIWWRWAQDQGPLGPVVLVLAGAVGALARYVVVLHRRNSDMEREARIGLDGLMRLLMEKKRNGERINEANRETDRRRGPEDVRGGAGEGGAGGR